MLFKLPEWLKKEERSSIPYKGVVVKNNDPRNLGRLKIEIEDLLCDNGKPDYESLPWIYPISPFGSGGTALSIPDLNSKVNVIFPYGDLYFGFYTGYWHTEARHGPKNASGRSGDPSFGTNPTFENKDSTQDSEKPQPETPEQQSILDKIKEGAASVEDLVSETGMNSLTISSVIEELKSSNIIQETIDGLLGEASESSGEPEPLVSLLDSITDEGKSIVEFLGSSTKSTIEIALNAFGNNSILALIHLQTLIDQKVIESDTETVSIDSNFKVVENIETVKITEDEAKAVSEGKTIDQASSSSDTGSSSSSDSSSSDGSSSSSKKTDPSLSKIDEVKDNTFDDDYPNSFGAGDITGTWWRINKVKRSAIFFHTSGTWIKVDKDGNTEINNVNDITVENGNNITLRNAKNIDITNGENITLKNGGDITIENSGEINITSDGNVSVTAPLIKFNS